MRRSTGKTRRNCVSEEDSRLFPARSRGIGRLPCVPFIVPSHGSDGHQQFLASRKNRLRLASLSSWWKLLSLPEVLETEQTTIPVDVHTTGDGLTREGGIGQQILTLSEFVEPLQDHDCTSIASHPRTFTGGSPLGPGDVVSQCSTPRVTAA